MQGVSEQEQAAIELWLYIIDGLVFVLLLLLIVFAFAIRFIAKRTTHPCQWCMEFISKKETVCPRCGKNVVPAHVA